MKLPNRVRFLTSLFSFAATLALAQDPKDQVNNAIAKARERNNYTWTMTSVRGPGDTSGAYMSYPAIQGRKAGEITALSSRGSGGEVEVLRRGDRSAWRVRFQWKTPDQVKSQAAAAITGDPNASADAIVIPADEEGIFLGADPTAMGGAENPYKPETAPVRPVAQPGYRKPPPTTQRRPLAGATLTGGTNAPPPLLADPATLAATVLAATSDPVAKVAELADVVTDLKPAGAGMFAGAIPAAFVEKMAGARKRYGDNQAPQVTDCKSTARFWTSEGSLYKYQVSINATVIVGPPYNPLPVLVNRTTTVEFRGVGSTRVDIPAPAAKLLP